MFVGHYAAGLALKKIDRKASLGLLFLGVLWNNAVATYVIESAFLAAGLWVYFRSTTGTSFIGRYGMGFFVVILLLINAINIFGPPFGDTKVSLAIPALAMYFLFAGADHWLDGKRS